MTDPLDVDPGELCPICGEDRDDCYEHLLANFGITEPDIGGGFVFDFTEDVNRLLIALVANSDMRVPDAFGSVVQKMRDLVRNGQSPNDAYSEMYAQVLRALRRYWDSQPGVFSGEYEVDEGSGTWEYSNYWTSTPKVYVHELLKALGSDAPGLSRK